MTTIQLTSLADLSGLDHVRLKDMRMRRTGEEDFTVQCIGEYGNARKRFTGTAGDKYSAVRALLQAVLDDPRFQKVPNTPA